mmetsp:Transcript_69133/g.122266  ORF Transcript_69133/g.122266 Transcript_69133/m.122266 type:complete len:108 (-) Transcript_69133:321-644(-)
MEVPRMVGLLLLAPSAANKVEVRLESVTDTLAAERIHVFAPPESHAPHSGNAHGQGRSRELRVQCKAILEGLRVASHSTSCGFRSSSTHSSLHEQLSIRMDHRCPIR